MSDSSEVGLMTPGTAASSLGVSGAALRRMAKAYAEVYGALPDGGAGRLWPSEAVERLRDARALMAAGRAKSVRGALEALGEGPVLPAEAVELQGRGIGAPAELVAELRALRREVEAMRGELSEMRALPPVEGEAMSERLGERKADGALVQWARRLERLLGRR